jgi:hypothetical protein
LITNAIRYLILLFFLKKGKVILAKIIDGKAIAAQVRAELKIEAMKWREQGIT